MIDHQLRALARGIAEHLDGFHVTVDDELGHAVWLDHTDGRRLFLRRLRSQGGRLEISGSYPPSDYYFEADERPDITVAIGRTPAAIATEITRRLLPGYNEVLAKVHAHIAKRAAEDASRAQIAKRLAALLPDASIHDNGHSVTTVHWYASGDGSTGSGHIELHNGGTRATLEARLPTATVERLMAVLASLTPASTGTTQTGRVGRRPRRR
ncbi:MAG TPA: hypothetical protein VFA45_01455 [Actinomycetes bacterium]|jgi:hypothetical protein|nr:hypothetical protein [Actinomycetes bacterium]